MSKSPIKDFSRLIETSSKTAKKETNIKDEPAYPSKLLRYDVLAPSFRIIASSMILKPSLMQHLGTTPDYWTKTQL